MDKLKAKTVYCKSCRRECIEVNCESCGNRHKGVCDRCIHWKGHKDFYDLSPYYITDKKE